MESDRTRILEQLWLIESLILIRLAKRVGKSCIGIDPSNRDRSVKESPIDTPKNTTSPRIGRRAAKRRRGNIQTRFGFTPRKLRPRVKQVEDLDSGINSVTFIKSELI